MARFPELPPEEKIRLLTADPNLTPAEADRYADLFLKAGKYATAMMFLERSRNPQILERVEKEAVRMGDAFLLHWIQRLLPGSVPEADWREAGERALREGKFLFARECFERGGDPEKAAKVREEWLRIFPAAPPPPAPARPG